MAHRRGLTSVERAANTGPPDPVFRSLVIEPVETAMARGDTRRAFDHFMRLVCADDYESVLRDEPVAATRSERTNNQAVSGTSAL